MKYILFYKSQYKLYKDLTQYNCEKEEKGIISCDTPLFLIAYPKCSNVILVSTKNKMSADDIKREFPNANAIFKESKHAQRHVIPILMKKLKRAIKYENQIETFFKLLDELERTTAKLVYYEGQKNVIEDENTATESFYIVNCPFECYVIKMPERAIVKEIPYNSEKFDLALELSRKEKLSEEEVKELLSD